MSFLNVLIILKFNIHKIIFFLQLLILFNFNADKIYKFLKILIIFKFGVDEIYEFLNKRDTYFRIFNLVNEVLHFKIEASF